MGSAIFGDGQDREELEQSMRATMKQLRLSVEEENNEPSIPSFNQALSAMDDHVRCSNVLKKRREKMRRHKHKKRLRANRYKTTKKT